VNRGRSTNILPPGSARLIARAIGTMRSTASWVALVGSVLTSSPPWATTTTPLGGKPVTDAGEDALSLMAHKHAGSPPPGLRTGAAERR